MKSLAFSILVNAAAFLSLFSIGANAQSAGGLDASFGTNGFVYTQLNQPFALLSDMAIQPDNKLIVLSYWQIVRFNQNGTIDDTFTQYPTTVGALCRPTAVQVLPDGKIIFGGYYDVSTTNHICLGRLNSNGTLDTSFDGDGYVQTMMGIESNVSSINVLPGGKILAAGWTSLQSTFNRDYAMVRYNPDGSLDTTFGTGGRVASELGSNEFSYASAIQSDGKIILVGDFTDSLSSQTYAAIVRYNSNGTLDAKFGNSGKVVRLAAPNGRADDVVIQPDGKIIIAGGGIAPVRYNSNGTLDTEFNTPAWIYSSALAIQPDGKILVSGATDFDNLILARYNINGTPDNSFGSGGIVSNTGGMKPTYVCPNRILLTSDRKIVLGGSRNNNNFEIVLARYLNNSTPMDFDGDGKTDLAVSRFYDGHWYILNSSNGAVSDVPFSYAPLRDQLVPADYTGDGKTDISIAVGNDNLWLTRRSEDYSLAYESFVSGSSYIPIPADYDGDGKADKANFHSSYGEWSIQKSTGGNIFYIFGAYGDKPVPADYDGDGKADVAIYRPSSGQWWINGSSQGVFVLQLGSSSHLPAPGDWTGDGKTDAAVFNTKTGEWLVLRSEDFSQYGFTHGRIGDIPAPGDYDGDGKFDAAFFRPKTGEWHIQKSTGGSSVQAFGTNGDTPIPSAYIYPRVTVNKKPLY